ncbi:MAG TPA: PD-(D/E)XK nuclease domain-containing protein, partial [Leptospiraceae bacterium]|nr:PD-(D/E)XK nuclease domain-containing protein [Leptospiraceae bacterium]
EKYWQTVFYLIFTLLGFRIQAEVKTNKGRIDAVVESKSIYIFEFKLNGTKEEALAQIKDKKYYEKYLSIGKPVILVGAEFKDRNIGDYLTEAV